MLIDAQITAQNRNSRLRPSVILDFSKFDFWLMVLVDFPSAYQIRWKNVDRRRNYGQKSKFKMAAVRHLEIFISLYRTTHVVFSLGYISLSNFVLIRYIVLKIFGFEIFAELAWNAYLCPKISVFWGSGPLKIIDHCRDPQKALLHLKPRIMSVNAFNSVHNNFVTCRRDERNCLCVCVCVCVCL